MIKHTSDCAMDNAPEFEPSEGDCGGLKADMISRPSSPDRPAGISAPDHQTSHPTVQATGYGRGSGLGRSMDYGLVKQFRQEGQANVPQAHGETVLVVEDDPDVRALSVALLSSLGYEILETADGQTALKVLESAPRVDLLFTDVVMPGGMSGPDLALEVQCRFPGIAVLYTSGYTGLANVDQSAFGKDIELLQKPYRKADLARKVRRALGQARS